MTYDGTESIPMATLVRDTVCCTMSGLSKIYRACGYRVGWAAFTGNMRGATDYLAALELLTSLRLCSNVPAQWAVQTALGGYQSVKELLVPGGRLYESRRAILEATSASRFLHLAAPKGSMYAFVRVKTEELPDFDDQAFALDLLEQKHVLLAPGTSFNVPYRDHFRTTLLPDAALLKKVFTRIDELLTSYAGRSPGDQSRVVRAEARFK
jgi:alanine-synthesizing transaminase